MPKPLRLILALLVLAATAVWWVLRTAPEAPSPSVRLSPSAPVTHPPPAGPMNADAPEPNAAPFEDAEGQAPLESEREPVVDGPGPCIELEVTANGAPAPGALVTTRYVPPSGDGLARPSKRFERLGASGRGRSWCNPGQYVLLVELPGFAPQVIELDTRQSSKELRLPLQMEPGHTLHGFVLDEGTHQPVEGAWVRLVMNGAHPPRQGLAPVLTDAQGAFQVSHLAAGLYSFQALAPGYAVRTGRDLRLPREEPLRILLEEASRLEGRVIDDATEHPVAGALVWLHQYGSIINRSKPEFTDAQGRFSFEVGAGGYHLTATARNLTGAHPVEIKVSRGSQLDGLIIRLAPTGRLSGKVFVLSDRHSGKRAHLELRHVDSGWESSAMTDANGLFRVEHLPPGQYEVSAFAPGFAEARRTGLQLKAGQELTVELALTHAASLEGTVTDALGQPVGQVVISATLLGDPQTPGKRKSEISDEKGYYKLERLPSGRYQLEARSVRWGKPLLRELTLAEGEAARADFTLPEASGQVAGTVRRASGELPLHEVQVLATSETTSVSTLGDETGHFTLTLEPGTYTFTASYAEVDEHGPERQVTVEAGQSTQVALLVPDAVTETTGLVLNSRGAPASKASVSLSNDELDAFQETDERGRFTLRTPQGSAGVPMKLTAELGPEYTTLEDVRVGSQDLVVRLRPSASLRGRVSARAGAPVKGFVLSVSRVDDSEPLFEPRSFPGETFTLNALPADTLAVRVRTTDGRSGTARVQLAPGSTGETELLVGGLGRVLGRLVDASGVPREGWVYLNDEREEDGRFADSDEAGRFELFAIEPGSHALEFSMPSSSEEESRELPFTLRPGETLDLGNLGPNTPGTRPVP